MICTDDRFIFLHVTRNLEVGSWKDFQKSHSVTSVCISLRLACKGGIRNRVFALLYKIVVPLGKILIQPAGVYVKTFTRFNVSFKEESLEQIHFKKHRKEKHCFVKQNKTKQTPNNPRVLPGWFGSVG